MLKANKPVNIGDHIPYVICTQGPEGSQPAQRAYHPDDVLRATAGMCVWQHDPCYLAPADRPAPLTGNELTLDYEWYLSTQILPPISRLCEPIEGTSPAILSERLGLDASKYARYYTILHYAVPSNTGVPWLTLPPIPTYCRMTGHGADLLEEGWGFTPKCMMDDSERFRGCLPLTSLCSACGEV